MNKASKALVRFCAAFVLSVSTSQAAFANQHPSSVPNNGPAVLVNFKAHQGAGPIPFGGEVPIDTVSVNCPVARCTVLVEFQAEVGLASQSTPYEWAIFDRIDGACGLGCAIQGLVRTDIQPDGGYITGNMRDHGSELEVSDAARGPIAT